MPDSLSKDELREKLASIEHERWADWQKWCHKVLRENLNSGGVKNLALEKVLERWDKQIATPYDKLSDKEKASDMEQVDRYWHLIEDLIKREVIKELKQNAPDWVVINEDGTINPRAVYERIEELSNKTGGKE